MNVARVYSGFRFAQPECSRPTVAALVSFVHVAYNYAQFVYSLNALPRYRCFGLASLGDMKFPFLIFFQLFGYQRPLASTVPC